MCYCHMTLSHHVNKHKEVTCHVTIHTEETAITGEQHGAPFSVLKLTFFSSPGFPLSKPDLLSWMDHGEDPWVPDIQVPKGKEIPSDASPGEPVFF